VGPGAAPAELIGYAAARARVLEAVQPLAAETVTLTDAHGRALRRDALAPIALPPFANSSMDGYAVRAADLAGASVASPRELAVIEVLPAGHVATRALAPGQAMRIMTGASVPAGADAVVPFEDCERLGHAGAERARFTRPATPGENIRPAGRDVAAGETALEAGRELSAHDLALLGALGFSSVEVTRRARVGILSTGDELVDVGEPLSPGAIRDTNRPMLAMLAAECGAIVTASEHVRDDAAAFAAAALGMLGHCDVVLSIGGVSAGDFDPVKLALGAIGDVALWRVAMKPGRPQAFGRPCGRLFFGLPGNPASVACVFEVMVRPALRRLQGFAATDRPTLAVRAAETIASREGRTDFVRVTLSWREGEWWATPAGEQVSGHLAPQSRAHALLEVPEVAAQIAAGDLAKAMLLRWPERDSA
jgi:molybdopterin molybdotransferase